MCFYYANFICNLFFLNFSCYVLYLFENFQEKDLIELKALSKVIGQDKEGGLLVGSVKSNLGHTEHASCLVGLVKALISLDSGMIPSNISFNKLNPQMPNKIKV